MVKIKERRDNKVITSNVIHRTLHISVGDAIATCFTIDVNGRQYLVTAKHVVSDISGKSDIRLFHENQWETIPVNLVGHNKDGIDISVLAPDIQLSPSFQLEPNLAGLTYGQDVYFLGFPYGLFGEIGELNREFPLPFVKRAIISCIQISPKGIQIVYLDGHNNKGFSGGPVVFKENNSNDFKVAAVISGYRAEEEPVYQGGQRTPFAYRYNTGIIISYGIKHAVDLIENNPIGVEIKS